MCPRLADTRQDTKTCVRCHIDGAQFASGGVNEMQAPHGFINPVMPASSACIGCYVSATVSSHAVANTTRTGESCTVFHSAGDAFAVDKMHAQH